MEGRWTIPDRGGPFGLTDEVQTFGVPEAGRPCRDQPAPYAVVLEGDDVAAVQEVISVT